MDLLPVHDDSLIELLNLGLELQMSWIVLKLVHDVIQIHEWIIDGKNMDLIMIIYMMITGFLFSTMALNTRRPIRPKPLIPSLTDIIQKDIINIA